VKRTTQVALLAALVLTACTTGSPFALQANGPFLYPASTGPAFDRVAIMVSVANRTGDDLEVNAADFLARDAQHRVYPANPTATVADARQVGQAPSLRGILPLPTITLRSQDVLTGFVVFDVPAGATPTELIWRQVDGDTVVALPPTR
jgi:hypothetical protein